LWSDFKNSKWHVLVVDDDPAMRDMIADYLMAQNIRASTAADRQQMVHVLAAGQLSEQKRQDGKRIHIVLPAGNSVFGADA
jgi:DNA-binding response OmpR family regulator